VSANCTVSFGGKKMNFDSCLDMDSGGRFKLAWTEVKNPNSNSKALATAANPTVLRTYFSGTPEVAGTWAGWGVSGTGKMVGADVIVGYANPADKAQTSVRPFHLSGYSGSSFLLDQTAGPLKVVNGSTQVEFLNLGATVHILADVTGVAEGQAVTVLWSGGKSVEDWSEGLLRAPRCPPAPSGRSTLPLRPRAASQTGSSNYDQKIVSHPSVLSTVLCRTLYSTLPF